MARRYILQVRVTADEREQARQVAERLGYRDTSELMRAVILDRLRDDSESEQGGEE